MPGRFPGERGSQVQTVENKRLFFAEDAIAWDRGRVMRQIFTDEVWQMGGTHTVSYVTCKADNSDRYNDKCLQHKYSKTPAWMFLGSVVGGKKGPCLFWEKD